MDKKTTKITTVRLPFETWQVLRKLEEQDKIKSIHDGILTAINELITKYVNN